MANYSELSNNIRARLLSIFGARKINVTYQDEIADCGFACFVMLANYWGLRITLQELKLRFTLSNHGASLFDLMNLAEHYHFIARALELKYHELKLLKTPCIILWNVAHFVVLEKVNKKGVIIVDPALGRRNYSHEEARRFFSGYALELDSSVDLKPTSSMKKPRLREAILNNKSIMPYMKIGLILSLILQITLIAAPFFVQLAIDEVVSKQDIEFLNLLTIVFGSIYLIETLVTYLRSQTLLRLNISFGFQLKSSMLSRLMSLPIQYFETRNVGNLTARFHILDQIISEINNNIIESLIDGVMSISFLVIIYMISPYLAMFTTIAAALYLAGRALIYRSIDANQREKVIRSAESEKQLIEIISNILEVKLTNSAHHSLNVWNNIYCKMQSSQLKIDNTIIGYEAFGNFVKRAEMMAIVYFGSHMAAAGDLSVGLIFAYVMFKDQFIARVNGFMHGIIVLRMMGVSYERLHDIILAKAEDSRSIGYAGGEDFKLQGQIECKNLAVGYSTISEPVLSNIEFNCAAGEKIAIIGASGSGKTTFLKTLYGALAPIAGTVSFDGIQPANINLKFLRSHFATVLQSSTLVTGTIFDNIFASSIERSAKEAVRVAKQAGLHDEIIKLDLGYNTPINELHGGLSEGQRQRLLLARALYTNPKYIFMDEPTSNLDAASIAVIAETLEKLHCTVVACTHESAILNKFDRVYKVEDGQLTRA